jgi:hypothetical protein
MILAGRHDGGWILAALIADVCASWCEGTAWAGAGWVWRQTRNGQQRRVRRGVEFRDRCDEGLGVGHSHVLEQGARWRSFDDPTGIHDSRIIRAPGHDRKVVCD